MAQTGAGFLHMRVDLRRSRKLTYRINRALARGKVGRANQLAAIRRQVDQRFDPGAAVRAMARYLTVARGYLARDDLSVASYHMGIGNLQGVIAHWADAPLSASTAGIVRADHLSYAKLFFTSSPDRHARAWSRLNTLNDDTRNYYWKVLAAERIMWLYRHNPRALQADEWLQGQKNSAEEVLHPRTHTWRFARPKDIVHAERRHALLRIPGLLAQDPPRDLAVPRPDGAPRPPRPPDLPRAAAGSSQRPALHRRPRAPALRGPAAAPDNERGPGPAATRTRSSG